MSNDFKDLFGEDWRPGEGDGEAREEERGSRPLNEKECRVVAVYEGILENQQDDAPRMYFVLLRDNYGRDFKIFVVRDVAHAISMALSNDAPDRPLTHDLMKKIIEKLGATIERVTIDDLWQDTFYARITITHGNVTQDVDARPSDAIALALRFRAPIYVAEAVLEAAQQES